MTLPASGSLKMSQVATELGVSQTGLDLNAVSVRNLAGVGASGPISFSQLRGKSAASSALNAAMNNASYTVEGMSGNTGATATININSNGTYTMVTSPVNGPGTASGNWLTGGATDGLDYELSYTQTDGSASTISSTTGTWYSLASNWSASVHNTSYASGGIAGDDTVTITIRQKSNINNKIVFSVELIAQGGCFAIGTMLRTPYGDRAVESLLIGDTVCSFNDPTMLDESVGGWFDWTIAHLDNVDAGTISEVRHTHQFVADESIRINDLHTTLNHVHFVFDGVQYGWKHACDITENDAFVDSNKQLVPITSIVRVTEPTTFVAVDVEDIDTLQVKSGELYVLSHNVSA